MTFAIEFSKSAQKEIDKLNPQVQRRVLKAIYTLGGNPRQAGARPMVGSTSWRLRAGDWRVIYDVFDDKLVVLVIKVGHRRDVYR